MPNKITEEEAKILIEVVREKKLGQLEITDYILSKAIEKLKTEDSYVGTLEEDNLRKTITLNYYEIYNNKEKIVEELENIAKTRFDRKEINENDYYPTRRGLSYIYEISQYMIGAVELIPEENIDSISDELFNTYKRFSTSLSYYTDTFARVFGMYSMEWNKASALLYLTPKIYKLFAIEFIKLYTGYEKK